MRGFRLLLVALAALLGVLVAALWFGPRLLDWNNHRATIEAVASATLGRPVTIEGPITLSLLPEPVLTAQRIVVADTGDGVRMAAQALRLRVALGPLLAGRIDARDLSLTKPNIALPWPLHGGLLAIEPPAWLSALSAHVDDGRLTVGGAVLNHATLSITTGGVGAALRVSGQAGFAGQAWQVRLRLAQPDAAGAATLDVVLDGAGPAAGTALRFSGRMTAKGEVSGQISAHGGDLSKLLSAPAVPFDAQAQLTTTGHRLAAGNLRLTLAGAPASGEAVLVLPRVPAKKPQAGSPPKPAKKHLARPGLVVRLRASRIALDPWLPVLLRGAAGTLPVRVHLSVEAATLEGGLLRGLHVVLGLHDGEVRVHRAQAVLPGEAAVHLRGTVALGKAPYFEGAIRLSAPAPRVTLHWLAGAKLLPTLDLPPDVMQSLVISADVRAEPGHLALSRIAGTLDGSRVSGGLALALGKQPAITGGLAFDKLALDPWVPARLLRTPPGLAEVLKLIGGLNADMQITAARARLGRLRIDHFLLDAAAKGGRLTLRRLDGAVQGVHATASGLLDAKGVFSHGRLGVTAPLATPLAALLPVRWRGPAGLWQGPVALRVLAAGPPGALGLRIKGEMAGLSVRAAPVLNLSAGSWAGPVTVRDPGAPRLLGQLGFPGVGAWLGEGSFSFIGQVGGQKGQLHAGPFQLIAGMLRTGGQLALATHGRGSSLTGRILADVLPLPMLPAKQPLPLSGLRGWQAAVQFGVRQVLWRGAPVLGAAGGMADLSGGRLSVNLQSARLLGDTLGGGTLSGSASVDAAASPPRFNVQARLAGARIDGRVDGLALKAPLSDGRVDVSAIGFSPAALAATLSGTASVTLGAGAVQGFDLGAVKAALALPDLAGAEAALRGALSGGSTGFDTLSAQGSITNGSLALEKADLQSGAGTVSATGSVDLARGISDVRLALHPALPGAPDVGLRIGGPLGAPSRIPELAAAAKWLAERPPPKPPAPKPAPTPSTPKPPAPAKP